MTTDELITNASPEQLREALREAFTTVEKLYLSWNTKSYIFTAITNALEGKE